MDPPAIPQALFTNKSPECRASLMKLFFFFCQRIESELDQAFSYRHQFTGERGNHIQSAHPTLQKVLQDKRAFSLTKKCQENKKKRRLKKHSSQGQGVSFVWNPNKNKLLTKFTTQSWNRTDNTG